MVASIESSLELKPYQRVGVEWLKTKTKALLADEMGLGKTAQAIVAAKELGCERILIVCPAIASRTWQRELQLWWGKTSFIAGVSSCDDEANLKDTWIVSFDYLTRHTLLFSLQHWDLLIVDESHFIKSINAKRTHAVLNPKTGVTASSPITWLMTGTPMPNSPEELYPMLKSFGEYKKSNDAFILEFCTWYQFQGRKVPTGIKMKNLPALRALLSKVMLRRRKKEVLKELPPITVSMQVVSGRLSKLPDELEDHQKELMEKLNKTDPLQQMAVLEGMAGSVSTLLRYAGLQVVEGVVELVVEEMKNKTYKQIVIFCIHTDVAQGLAEGFRKNGLRVGVITGATLMDARQDIVDLFQKGELDIVVGNIKAAGTNITLTAADQIIMVEQSWVPAENQQAWARCHRIGQKNPVYVRVTILENSVHEKVAGVLIAKALTISKVLGENNEVNQSKGHEFK